MARRTLGAFIERSRVPSPPELYREVWSRLATAPAILHPRHVGNWEPLRKIEAVNIDEVTSQAFIFGNGRKVRGWVSPPAFLEHRYFTITIHLTLAENDLGVADEVYDWLRDNFAASLTYMGNPSRELMESNLELHQMLNSGLVEIKLDRALAHRGQLDRIDMAV